MVWVPYCPPPGETPAHYRIGRRCENGYVIHVLCDDVHLGAPYVVEYAKAQRKEVMQIRESLIAAQKQCGRNDRELARELRELSADLMKQYRGWDYAVKFMEGDILPDVQEEIALHADRAFDSLDLFVAQQPRPQ